ncbi:hydantoinase B/oxoprolinase family protein [Crenalkalicoccus roseus]|uniref:hydantoinase B/oxoprolinase family protein n=1 Tax=Crenalkalicoccus roseus TaxID=1485588 RepID=UPI00108014E6|nr:hydantoinase B/oxoprolinase family protein [Crenalkalicoccus roseus]
MDPFLLEVLRHALSSIAEEMSSTVVRAARSPLLREAGDLSSALTDARGELVAQGRDIPVHLGVMNFTVKALLRAVPAERLRPGDVWVTNLPEMGGNHLPDVKAIRPLFAGGRLVAFAVSLAHWADIGGAWPGSYVAEAHDSWAEGLRIPPTRMFTAEGRDEEKIAFLLANVRGPAEREGDLLAQVAATRAAEERFAALCAEHGAATVEAAMAALHDRSEAAMRAAIAGLPDGVYEGEDFLDDDGPGGAPVGVRVRVTIAGERAAFDFSASDDAVAGPMNTTPNVVAAACYYAMKAIAGPEIQPNGGCYRPIGVITRPGSLLDPPPGRPLVGGNHETSNRCVDAIFRALADAIPERISAGGPTTAGVLILGGTGPDGAWQTLYEVHGAGEGARHDRPGVPVTRVHLTNTNSTPAEIIEAEFPVRVECHALRLGSGGEGRHRGGEGAVRAYRVLAPELSLTTMFERRVVPPWGLAGGGPGLPFRCTLHEAGGGARELRGKQNLMVRQGDLIVMETSGGGGYGRPA